MNRLPEVLALAILALAIHAVLLLPGQTPAVPLPGSETGRAAPPELPREWVWKIDPVRFDHMYGR